MGSRLGGNGSPPAVLHFLVDTLTSWLAALLSVIPILRGKGSLPPPLPAAAAAAAAVCLPFVPAPLANLTMQSYL